MYITTEYKEMICWIAANDGIIKTCIFTGRCFVILLASEMNITGTLPKSRYYSIYSLTLPQAGNLKRFVPSLSTQGSTRPKQNIFNVVLMRPDKTE